MTKVPCRSILNRKSPEHRQHYSPEHQYRLTSAPDRAARLRPDDKHLRRAGLDYHEFARLKRYQPLAECITQTACDRILAFTTKASSKYAQM